MKLAGFPPDYRAAGVLLHVTSLPSPYGVGDLGPSAYRWVDRLTEAGQSWWQILPLGPTWQCNSPYDALSTFAGNPLLISPDRLVEDGLLDREACQDVAFTEHEVDYDAVAPWKRQLLDQAWSRFEAGAAPDLRDHFARFRDQQAWWLDDYALFRALSGKLGADHLQWPEGLRRRDPAALSAARQQHARAMDVIRFSQFLFFRQLKDLRRYAGDHGLELMGDLPFFIAPDSSDVWASPDRFLLDEDLRPRVVAGVPPDYFSADGQLWGNPIYDWEAMRQTGYRWWIDRLRALLSQVDLLRLDHFRAFVNAWHVPAESPTARNGEWRPGPGADFFREAGKALGGLPLVAEDLGLITDDVYALRDEFNLPGMRVLQFAFDGNPNHPFLPHNFLHNTVAYTGTHDNDTTRGWYRAQNEETRRIMWEYLGREPGDESEVARELLRIVWNSRAALTIAPLQDLLNLGSEARMNVPGRPEGNWRWRVTEESLTPQVFEQLREMTEAAGRLP
jgi:4-alpha-glucanotransferase